MNTRPDEIVAFLPAVGSPWGSKRFEQNFDGQIDGKLQSFGCRFPFVPLIHSGLVDEVSRGGKMTLRGTNSESYITGYT